MAEWMLTLIFGPSSSYMSLSHNKNQAYTGIGLAILATVIWSGNFIIARGVMREIPPVSLAFFRWLCASIIIAPFAWRAFRREWDQARRHWIYLFWVSLFGIALFNTFLYVAGHFSSAINLALIGTTSSPVMSIILAAVFLKERIRPLRIAGLLICIAGIVLLLSNGSWQNLSAFHFARGDGWILLAALCFAIYNIFARRKPVSITSINFLFIIFSFGTVLLLPAYLVEKSNHVPMEWNPHLVLIILYLGLGTSVAAYLCWNAAIARLGAGRTALFGNLIPIFSSLEAVWILQESFTWMHLVSGILVIGGLVIANLKKSNAT